MSMPLAFTLRNMYKINDLRRMNALAFLTATRLWVKIQSGWLVSTDFVL
jgi:hypothetical protein